MKQNYSCYNVSQRLIIYIFTIGLFLQSCSGENGLPFPAKKKQHRIYKQLPRLGSVKDKRQNGLQVRWREQVTSVLYLNGHQQRKNQGMGVKKKKEEIKKRKRIKNQENEKGRLNGIKYQRLESTTETTAGEVKKGKKRKRKKSKCEKAKLDVRVLKQKKIKANQQVNGGYVEKRKKPSYGTEDKEVLMNVSKQVKKRRKAQIGLLDLPEGILQDIISHLPFRKRMLVRELNHFFYTISTGYKQVGMIGVANKPDYDPDPRISTWSIDKVDGIAASIDFEKLINRPQLICTPERIPSFIFLVWMRQVEKLPKAYWPWLKDTQIRTVRLSWGSIKDTEMEEFGKSLQGKVHRIELCYNRLGSVGVEAFVKSLPQDTKVCEFDLSSNKITNAGAAGFTEHILRTARKIDISANAIEADGAIAVAKNLQGKEVEEINLGENKIKNGVIGVLQNLQGTSVKRLYLECNAITDEGIIEAMKYILKTNLEELCLGCNKITDKGAIEIVKSCRGTKMKELGLNFNRNKDRGITNEGVLKIVENIEGTALEEIDLRQYKPKFPKIVTRSDRHRDIEGLKEFSLRFGYFRQDILVLFRIGNSSDSFHFIQ